MIYRLIAIVFTLLSVSLTAWGNDGAAGLVGGELRFKEMKGVRLVEEELYLSFDKVEVSYRFENTTAAPLTTLISFPIELPGPEGDTTFDREDENPLGFRVEVDGKEVPFQTRKEGTEGEGEWEEGGRLHHYWRQTFPGRQVIRISHSYRPVYDQSVEYGMLSRRFDPEHWQSIFGQPLEKDFCATPAQVDSMRKRRLQFKVLTYILQTASTWDGPIGTFRLIIDKGRQPFLFLCTDLELKKRGNNQFEAIARDFIPQRDLAIAFMGRWES